MLNMLKLQRIALRQSFSAYSKKVNITSTAHKMDHLDRTASNTRDSSSWACTVKQLVDLSPTVKKLSLDVQMSDVTFKPGQWVDFFIPGRSTIGGFSICSSPKLLQEEQTIELAVKKSSHPPAAWIHKECKEGSHVVIRVGGDFFLSEKSLDCPLLLLAGGVGINPLLSVLLYASEMQQKSISSPSPVVLLYSASTQAEMIFANEIKAVTQNCPWIHVKQFATREDCKEDDIMNHRINEDVIAQCFSQHFSGQREDVVSFLCGPSPFIDSMKQHLVKANVREENIQYEKWW